MAAMTDGRVSDWRRKRSRSKRAKEAPRDAGGRFAKVPKTFLVIDDFGDVVPYSDRESSFGYAVTVTDDIDSFGNISKEDRRRHGHPREERKASDESISYSEKLEITREIAALGAEHIGCYIDKKDPPDVWTIERRPFESRSMWKKRKNMIRKKVLSRSMDTALRGRTGEIEIIIDHHDSYSGIPELCQSKSKRGVRNVKGNQYDSSKGKYHDALQTQDFVANAAYADRRGFHGRRNILKMMKKLR